LPPHPLIPTLTAAIAISIHNALLSLRRRRTQKASTPNGRNANTVRVAEVRNLDVLKPSGSVAGVETSKITATVDPLLIVAYGTYVVAVLTTTTCPTQQDS
jgi:hypothetical protein